MIVEIRKYDDIDAPELVTMWRVSFQRAMGLEEHNRIDEFESQLDFLGSLDPSNISVAITKPESLIVGMMVLDGDNLDQLYVHVDYQCVGIGSRFITQAKNDSPTKLELHTFQANFHAQKFYTRQGFREVERGFAEFVGNPWASHKQELADITYCWTP